MIDLFSLILKISHKRKLFDINSIVYPVSRSGTGDYTFAVWESGDIGYDASNPYRNSNAHYFMPTEDEWVKAAYWNGMSFQTYANASHGDLVSGYPDPTKLNYNPLHYHTV